MAGAVGRDALATDALILLKGAGVDLTRVAETDTTTGCAAISVDPRGSNAIAVGSGANLLARNDRIEDALLTPQTTLVLQMEVPADQTAALIFRAKARGARTILNLAPAAALPVEALKAIDILTVNETEADWLAVHLGCGADAPALHAALGVTIVRTLGENGVDVATSDGVQRIPAQRIVPVDTTAAGDCFVGVFAAALDRGQSLAEALSRATTAAALCCMKAGSQGSLPWAGEIDAYRPATG
jgi:ribokinase